MKNNGAQKFSEAPHDRARRFEVEVISLEDNTARLKSLRLAKEASDKARGIEARAAIGARIC